MDSIGGLVAHPLFVHLPVVLVPLAAIGVVAMVVRPSLQRTWGPVVGVLAGAGFLGVLLAASSGEALEERYEAAGQTISATLEDHATMGERAEVVVGLFFVATVAWLTVGWWRRSVAAQRPAAAEGRARLAAVVLTVAALLGGVAATAAVTLTGHSGAESVWEQTAP